MVYRQLGRAGIRISCLTLGTGNFGDMTAEETAGRIMEAAIAHGINLFDTADAYVGGESERIIGRFLAATGQRDHVLLATKVYYPTGPGPNDQGLSRHHIVRACEASLRRLQTDRIDLYLTHRSASQVTPIEETLEAMTDLVRQGKICYIGCSTYPAWQVMEALAASERHGYARFVAESPPYNLLDRRAENARIPLCLKYGLGVLPWSPLAMGMLAGRYPADGSFPAGSRAAQNPTGIYAQRVNRRGAAVGARVAELAPKYGLAPGQLALLWLKDQPGVTSPIVGPRTPEQLGEMLKVVDLTADDELRATLDALNPPGTAVANFHNTSGWVRERIDDPPDPGS
ncbi:MAG TPA: aldo/keto reductase [Methylomirabilota bacterium]|jgi:aryl-alcohol dehydrogenase-like predicted oxidoreductase|nr:aldo/keto reductase [Methylomirabilota bacterium]